MNSIATDRDRAPVLEAFASIQGEGRYVGQPQVFLRLFGCPLRCSWCDTPGSWNWRGDEHARIDAPGGVREEPAYVTAQTAADWVNELDPSGRRPLSLTGGEPLLWTDFLIVLKPLLGARRLHLESAGAHPAALERVRDLCDHLSLDLKLPADMRAPVELPARDTVRDTELAPRDESEWTAARRAVLTLASSRDAALKLVVAGGRAPSCYEPLLADAHELASDLPLIVQPATPMGAVTAPEQVVLDAILSSALELGLDARLLPQIHRLLGLP